MFDLTELTDLRSTLNGHFRIPRLYLYTWDLNTLHIPESLWFIVSIVFELKKSLKYWIAKP